MRVIAKIKYACATLFAHPTRRVLNDYFASHPDTYRMTWNGDERFHVIADVINHRLQPCRSILDLSCYEGYGLRRIAERTGVCDLVAMDISDVAIARAREQLKIYNADFVQFDLNQLYAHPACRLPIPHPCDVVLVCELLYYVGPSASHLWADTYRSVKAKMDFIQALQKLAGKAVIVQHFGARERDSIGTIIEMCGGEMIEPKWGLYLLKGAAGASNSE